MRVAVAVLVVALPISACSGGESAAPPQPAVDVALGDFMIMPMDFSTKAGNVVFRVHNDGQTPHDFTIRQDGRTVAESRDLNPGEQQELAVRLESGTYDVYCAEPGHESLGMRSALTVS